MLTPIKNRIGYYLDGLHDLWLRIRLRNKPYRDYYRAIMKKTSRRNHKTAVGKDWNASGPAQLERLIKYGMQPSHTMLDIGCGSLRGGMHFIQYLEPGNYWGIDISEDILEAAQKMLHEHDLKDKRPTLAQNIDLTFSQFNRTFDYIHAQSVLSHMPVEDMEELFANIGSIMHADSMFLASFFEGDRYHPSVRNRNFFYPFITLQKMGEKNNLLVERGENVPFFQKQQLIVVRKK